MRASDSISVVVPTHNRAHLIERALDCALGQMQPGDEIVVIDDGSTDDTEAVVGKYGDRVRYVRTENGGAGAARNRGVAEARCALVALLDSDDEWMDGKLDLVRTVFRTRPDVLFAFTDMAITTPEGGEERHYLKHWHDDPRSWDEILSPGVAFSTLGDLPAGIEDFQVHTGRLYELLAQALYMFTSTVVARRVEAGDALRFEEGLPMFEDWLCYARLAKKGTGAYLDIETAWQHAHSSDRLTDADDLKTADTRIEILNRLWRKDADYMRVHGETFERLMQEQHRIRAARLIAMGRRAEAREAMRQMEQVPLSYRVLAALPGLVTRGVLGVRAGVKALLPGS